jgi:hypothetical protein
VAHPHEAKATQGSLAQMQAPKHLFKSKLTSQDQVGRPLLFWIAICTKCNLPVMARDT